MSESRSAAGYFIVFEGPDGGGKTTQSQGLATRLQELNHDVKWTREPGGTALAEMIRDVVLKDMTYGHISPIVEALLLSAARSQHVEEVIRPNLEAGRVVVCDRYKYSTIAYQGGGSRLNIADLEALNKFSTHGLDADRVILVDIDSKEGLRRKFRLGDDPASGSNKMELRGIDYHERVRVQFREMANAAPDRWMVIDGAAGPDEIAEEISSRVLAELESRSILPASVGSGRPL